jgi:hypothetical protein
VLILKIKKYFNIFLNKKLFKKQSKPKSEIYSCRFVVFYGVAGLLNMLLMLIKKIISILSKIF